MMFGFIFIIFIATICVYYIYTTRCQHRFEPDNLINIMIFLLIVTFVIIYYHPTKEVMECDQNKICNVERTYFGIYKINKKIELTPSSQLSCNINMYFCGRRNNSSYGLYLKYDDVSPFVFYVEDSSYHTHREQMKQLNEVCDLNKEKFEQYINNQEEQDYKVSSKASTERLWLNMLIVVALIIAIAFFKR